MIKLRRIVAVILMMGFMFSALSINPQSGDVGISHAQSPLQAELLLSLHQDPLDGAAGIVLQVPRVIDPTTGDETATLLGSFQAVLTYDGSCVNILDVRELDFTLSLSLTSL